MTDKERLEEMQKRVGNMPIGMPEHVLTWRGWESVKIIFEDDYKYLVERAKRVQELEEENINLKAIKAGNQELIKLVDERTETLENKYLALRNIHNITLKTGELVAEENKQQKQALEKIREMSKDSLIDRKYFEIADEALEGEE